MLSPRWSKVIRDLWGNKTRTALVVLSIAVGVFAIGMVAGTQDILFRELAKGYNRINPVQASISTDLFDQDLVDAVRRVPGVQEAQGRTYFTVRMKKGPDAWQNIQVGADDHFETNRINKIFPQQGAWPPPKHEILIERGSMDILGTKIGDVLTIEGPDGKEHTMRVSGTVHDINLPPASFVGIGFAYVNLDTAEWLGMPRLANEMLITVTGDSMNKAHVTDVANLVKAKIEKSGRTAYGVYVPTPGQHPAVDAIKPIMTVLSVMGVLALLLGGFLVINTVTAILAQQVRQIGIMKSVGARVGQVTWLYLGMVALFGVLSLLVAVPLGALAAGVFTGYLAKLVNFDILSYSVPVSVILQEVAVGLAAPLLASLWPVLNGARVTVREAIASYGLTSGKLRRVRPDKPAARNRRPLVSRPLLLSLRNTFRRRGRLALTLITLTLAGAIFMGIFSVQASLNRTLDEALQYWAYDSEIQFSRPYRSEDIVQQVSQVPGVARAESWGYGAANRVRQDDTQSDTFYMVAPPASTDMIKPIMLQGRWLLPEDENAVVVNTEVLKSDPEIRLGDDIVLKMNDQKDTWRVVGVAKGLMTGRVIYANKPYFERLTGNVGRAMSVEVVMTGHDAATQTQITRDIERHLKSVGMRVRSSETIGSVRERVQVQFNIALVFLMVMVSLLALVGGLGLMGTMSINVLERTREIGVLRAIGAGTLDVMQLVVVEGILIGLLSWTAGLVLALPLSQGLSMAMGMAMIQAPLSYTFSVSGPVVWLVLVIVLAGLASALPARSASRVSVREVLAYE